MFAQYIPWVACLPFQIIFCITVLFYYLGWGMASGILIFIITFFINGILGKKSSSYQKEYMKR